MIINEELNRKINVAKKIFYENFELNDEFHFEVYLCKDKDELYILNSSLFINICNKNTLLEAIENMLEFLFY